MHSTMMTGFSSNPNPEPDIDEMLDENGQPIHDPDDVYTVPVAGVGVGSYKLKPKPVEDKPVNPEVDIPELFEKMKPQRDQLYAIIDFCREERSSEEIDAILEPLRAHRRSVYTPVILRDLLLRNGALEYITEELDEPEADEDASVADEAASEIAAADDAAEDNLEGGVQFLEVPEEVPGTWLATPEALAFIQSRTPRTVIDAMLAEKPEREPIYLLVLKECADEPRSTQYLDQLIESHPLAQNPQRFGSYFVGRLEDADALVWEGAWKTAEAARYLIEEV